MSEIRPNNNDFILYTPTNGPITIETYIKDETIWLTQQKIADLFEVDRTVVTKHLKNIYQEEELQKEATSAKFAQVQKEGEREGARNQKYYNLAAIISVEYRVNSTKATQFRIWATNTLKEYIIKGFVLDDERLKQGQTLFGKDYFRELLQRVRSIRASERRIYQQVTDIFAECCIDYDKNAEITKGFYAMVQNKFHFAITGKTAAEIIYKSADSKKENMGLTTWKNAPDGRVLKQDVIIAKNYLEQKEIQQLERTVTSYFDYIEGLIEREHTFTMVQLASSVNKFLSFNDYKVLEGKGKMKKITADKKAIKEYDTFNKTQKIISDFDKVVKGLKKGKK